MKTEYIIISGDSVIAIVYSNEKYGKIIVFREGKFDLDMPIIVHSTDNENTGKENKESIAELIMKVIPV